MIFTFTNADKGLDAIFQGKEISIKSWQSVIPSPDLAVATLFDPQLIDELYNATNSKTGISYVGSLYLFNAITSIRVAIGKLAGIVGFLKNEFNNISNIFSENADNAEFIFNALNSAINSELFQRGMDALGAIPIVGWIIKIIAKVAEMVYNVIVFVRKNKIENAKQQLTGQPWIPIAEFNKDADELLTKLTLEHVSDGDLDWVFSPRNYFEKFEDFRVQREKRKGADNNPLEKTDFFNVTSYNMDGHGLGFIPGGITIAGPMRFPTGFCNEVLNAGELYPTAVNAAGAIYQIIQKNGPALYSIHTDKVMAKWETTILNLIEYAKKSVKLGWTCSPTGIFNTNKFTCNKDTENRYPVKGCDRKTQYNNTVSLPSKNQGHYTALMDLIGKLYYDTGIPTDFEKSIPSKALSVLKERQYAIIDSINCMYVDDSIAKQGMPRFSAIYNDQTLKTKWKNNVTAVLNSKDEWRKVVFWDVPQGPVREQLREVAKNANINPEKPGPIDPGTLSLKIPSILPDPKVPSPYQPKFDVKRAISSGKKGKTSSNTIPLTIAGLGAAFLLLRGN